MGVKRKPLSPTERQHWAEVAGRLVELRGARSKTAIARKVGVTAKAYAAWEKGESRITDANLRRLARVYGTTEEQIAYGQDKPTRRSQLDRIERITRANGAVLNAMAARLLSAEELEAVREHTEALEDLLAAEPPATLEADTPA